MENLNDEVCICPGSLGINEGATVRGIGSSELRVTSHADGPCGAPSKQRMYVEKQAAFPKARGDRGTDHRLAGDGKATTDFGQPISSPTGNQDRATSVCEPYRELIEQGLARRRNAIAIWQDSVSAHGHPHGYQTLSALFAGCADRSRHKPWGSSSRLLHHGHIVKCGPRNSRTKLPAEP
jgi:hypothetical protein